VPKAISLKDQERPNVSRTAPSTIVFAKARPSWSLQRHFLPNSPFNNLVRETVQAIAGCKDIGGKETLCNRRTSAQPNILCPLQRAPLQDAGRQGCGGLGIDLICDIIKPRQCRGLSGGNVIYGKLKRNNAGQNGEQTIEVSAAVQCAACRPQQLNPSAAKPEDLWYMVLVDFLLAQILLEIVKE
jgi:hypothetical protein